MKPFLTLALIACTAVNVNAQSAKKAHSLSIGINAGACWNTRPSNGSKDDKSGVAGSIAGLGLYYRINNHWEVGAAADYRILSIRSFDRLRFEEDFDPATGTYVHDESYYHKTVYYPAIAGKLLVNYHFSKGKLDAYAGVSAGYLSIMKEQANDRNPLMWKIYSGANSFVPGVHLGANYPLSSRLSLNAQVGGEAVFISHAFTHLNVISTAGTLGVRFRF